MERCWSCGSQVPYPFHQFGCIQCGDACCPACAFSLESATYCAGCVESILEAALETPRLAAIRTARVTLV